MTTLQITMERGWLEHAAMRHTIREIHRRSRTMLDAADHGEVEPGHFRMLTEVVHDELGHLIEFVDAGYHEASE